MNDQRYKDVHSGYSKKPYRTASPLAPLFFVFICLLGVSLPVASGQTNKTSQPASHPPQAGSSEQSHNTASPNDRPGLDASQPAVVGCGTFAQSESGIDRKSQFDGLLHNTDQTRPAFTCLSSVQHIYDGWSRNEAFLIDVRRVDEFQKYQIPDSLNLKPFSIKSKQFLKDKRIVLVNEGHYLSQLEGLCIRLKAEGFHDVAVMAGGLHAWHQAGFPVIGDRLELSKLTQISPAELISSLHERDWKFIDLDRSLSSLVNLLTTSEAVEYQANKADFIAAVNQANRQFDHTVLNGFLVVNSHGGNYRQIEHLLQLTEAKNIFYLTGGITELKRYLNTHSSLISRLAKGFKEPHRCSG